MPLQATSGAASYDAFGGGVPAVPAYIEEVFSTYLYTGNETSQTINNGIDLAGKGGLVWIKKRNASAFHILSDTARGIYNYLQSDSTDAQISNTGYVTAFNSDGFSIGGGGNINYDNLVSWTFREQPKFFDVVTYTGNGSTQTINHNLGSAPGCIIVKSTSASGSNWFVYHRSLGVDDFLILNLTNAALGYNGGFSNITSTSFGVADSNNGNGVTFVAYLWAHDAGGFGLTGTDNVISCGSFTTDASADATINLGYEPQWVMYKRTDSATNGNWTIVDTMRGYTGVDNVASSRLFPNTSGSESTATDVGYITPTGFVSDNLAVSGSFIYIAIRRGPMKVPTVGTSVFGLSARSGTGANATVTGGQTDDAVLIKNRGSAVASLFSSRLTGTGYLVTSATDAEVAAGTTILQANPWDVMDGVKVGTTSTITNASANTYINYLFKRAPSVFDVVCYTGTGSGQVINHNLGVTPELLIFKARNNLNNSGYEYWYTNAPNTTYALALNLDVGESYTKISSANSTTVSLGSSNNYVLTNQTYVAYLFATCAGVSKVGSYTGTATTKQIDCGFTAGARFVLIKRTDSTGDWYVWDSARGIVAGNDPYLLLNSTAAEVTNTDYVDTYNAGFEISSTAPAAINASGGTFVFLAIA